MFMKLNTKNIEYDCEMNGANSIVEVAVRHGFDVSLKDEFLEYVEQRIQSLREYTKWEEDMGDDL